VSKKKLIVNYFSKYNYLLFLVISFLSLIGFLSTNTSFGFVWDWSIPSNELFLRSKLENNELYWNNSLYGGFNNSLNFELWFWRFIGTLNKVTFGKEIFFSLFIFQILCFVGFYKIGKIYKKRYFLISLFYIYSYYAFSRLIAGHINLVFFYWSLPIIFVCLYYLYKKNLRQTIFYQIILILVSLIVLSHPISLFIFFFLLIFFFFKEIINNKNKKSVFFIFSLTLIIFFITQFHLTLTFYNFIFNSNNLFENYRELQEVSNEIGSDNFLNNLLRERVIQHEQKSFGIVFYIYTLINSSMFYENVFSINIILIKIIFFLSFLIIIAYSVFLSFQKIINYKLNLIYIAFLVITFILICGSNNLLSKFFYDSILYLFPKLFTIFANPLRFAPLFIFFLSLILLLNDNFHIKKIIFLITLISIVHFFFFKFHNSGKYTFQNIQTNQIIKKQINPEEIKILEKLNDDKDFYKIVIMPPAFLSWSYSDNKNFFTIPWNSNYFSKSNLLLGDSSPLERYSNKFFFTINNRDFNYNLLLKINNIKYLVVPNHEKIYLYKNFIKNYKKNTFDSLQDYSELFKLNLDSLKLKKSKISTNNIDIYEVNNYYPEFYCPTKHIYSKKKYYENKEILKFIDNINDYYIFTNIKTIKLCKERTELIIQSPRKNIYNIISSSGKKIDSIVFNNSYDKDWIIVPNKNYQTYLEIIYYLLNKKENKVTNHVEANFRSNYWDFDVQYNSFTIFNYNEIKFYFIKIFQILLIVIYILIIFKYFFRREWKR
jgi:hypothetical protein